MNTNTDFMTTKEVMEALEIGNQTHLSFLISLGLISPLQKVGRSYIYANDEADKCKARIKAGILADVGGPK